MPAPKQPVWVFYLIILISGLGIGGSREAGARSWRMRQLPVSPGGCNTCHIKGGGNKLNPFGLAVKALVTPGGRDPFWGPELAGQDSDGDGVSNGQELGDPDGDGVRDRAIKPSNPGDPASVSKDKSLKKTSQGVK